MTKKRWQPTVLVDMDGTAVDMHKKIITRYNNTFCKEPFNAKLATMADLVQQWNVRQTLKHGAEVEEWFKEPGFFLDLEPMAGAVEGVKAIHDAGNNVVILTAHSGHHSASEKVQWLQQHMPFIKKKNVFIGHQKHLVRGDVFIDDSPEKIIDYRRHWPDAFIATVAYPFSLSIRHMINVYADSYLDTVKAWQTISKEVIDRCAYLQLQHGEP